MCLFFSCFIFSELLRSVNWNLWLIFEKFWPSFLKYFFCPEHCLLFWDSNYTYVRFWYSPISLVSSVVFPSPLLFLLVFQFGLLNYRSNIIKSKSINMVFIWITKFLTRNILMNSVTNKILVNWLYWNFINIDYHPF